MPIDYHDLTHSPLGLWQLDGDLLDSSGNGLDLAVVAGGGTRYTELLPGIRGLYLDDLTHVHQASGDASLELLGDMTLEMLIAPDLDRAGTEQVVVTHQAAGATEAVNGLYAMTIGVTDVADMSYFAEQGAGVAIRYTVNSRRLGLGGVYHWAMVRANAQVQFYLNGALAGAASSGLLAPTGGGSGTFTIGGTPGSAVFDAQCAIASVKLIGSALSAAQVLAEYDRTLGGDTFSRVAA